MSIKPGASAHVATSVGDESVDSDAYVDGSIDTAHLAADAVDGTKIADDAIDSEHYTDGSIDTAHLAADAVDGTKLADNAVDSEHYTDGSIDSVHIAAGTIAMDRTTLAAGTNISLSTNTLNVDDAFLINDGNDTTTGIITSGGLAVSDSKFAQFSSSAGTPGTDNSVQGIVIEFLAVEAITQFDAVYVSTTTGRVGRANAAAAGTMPAIGIAIEAQGSAGSSVRVLTHGVYRDDGGFGGNMTVGVPLYTPETDGTLTVTAPSSDGDFVQKMGVAIGVRSAFINPSMDIIEHA